MFQWKNYLLIEKMENKMNKTSLTAMVRLVLFQAVTEGGDRLKRMREVSTSAEVDLRLCLKKPQTFEKV